MLTDQRAKNRHSAHWPGYECEGLFTVIHASPFSGPAGATAELE
jgi:hypothetical protein